VIETESLTKTFDGVTALDRLTLRVEAGEVFGLLGPNGAGKTTTVRILSCLIAKTSGRAWIGDYEVGDPEDSLEIRRIIGVLPENVGLYDELSAYDNLDFYARLYERTPEQRAERIRALLTMLGLWGKRDAPVATFSKGMRQKIAIARAVVHDPKVLFLDEPTANLDPESARTVRDFILDLRAGGRTIFLNTHHLDEADRICDRVGILKTRLVTAGAPKDLRRSLWGSKTVVQLERVSDSIVAAVRKKVSREVEVDGDRLVIGVGDPAAENPGIVSAIVLAGGKVRFVTELRPSLEDVYIRLVRP